ncbi:MAG: leucine-rich repeat protein [Bacteroidaceae bacterium]|nr:leucine-rich repeat protein [Bacteroidaceae bacterium]
MKTLTQKFNQVLTALLTIAALMVGQTVRAQDPTTGTCGAAGNESNVTWTVTDTDNNNTYETLTISGTGAMANYNSSDSNQPWKNYKSNITTIIIEDGVTTIGTYAFSGSSALQKVYCMSTTAPTLGSNAFDNCTSLSAIVKPAASDYSSWKAYSDKLKPGYTVTCNVGVTATSDWPLVQQNEKVTLGYTKEVSSGCGVAYAVIKASDNSDITNDVLSSTILTMPDGDVTVNANTYKNDYITHWQAGPYHDGSAADKPYVITTSAGLNLLASEVNNSTDFSGKFFILDNDISYGSSGGSNYFAIGTQGKPFAGTFDGKGYAISGIIIYNTTEGITCQGLFGYVDGGTVKNVTVANSQIGGNNYVAGIVGYCNSGTISNCFVYNTKVLPATGNNCGIIVGNNKGTLTNNYYRECTLQKGGTNYTTNIGYYDDAKTPNTLTDKEGVAEPVYTLTAGSGVSVIGEATITYDSKGFYPHNAPATIKIKDDYVSYMAPGNNLIYFTVKNESGTPDISGYGLADGWTFPMPAADIDATINNIYNQALALFDDDSTRPAGKKNIDYISKGGSDKKVILQDRTLYKDGAWNTLCLPFNASLTGDLANAVLMELDKEVGSYSHQTGFENGTLYLNFKTATSIEAGKPYIVKWTTTGDPIQNPMFTGVTINDTMYDATSDDRKVSFKGTYSPVMYTKENKSILFLGYDSEDTEHHSKLYYPQAGATIGACRAYFELNGITAGDPTAGVKAFVLSFGEDDATGINSLTPSLSEGEGTIYNLSGQLLQKMQKGINIVNSKKILK